jgi:prepilin-type processing-associated H-X9-DG protein
MSATCGLRSSTASRRRRSGFSLVEILVVVGVLIVLISILVPVVSKARAQASRTKCTNSLRTLGQAVTAFAGEHNATLPTCGLDKPVYGKSTDWIGWGGIDAVNKTDYMNESGLAKYLGFGTPDQSGAPNESLRKLYRCPSAAEDQRAAATAYPFDYQFNAQLSGMPVDRVERASEKGMIVETDNRDDGAFDYWTTGSYPPNHAGTDKLSGRHAGRGDNCLYADGHVDIIDPKFTDPINSTSFTAWDAYYTPATSTNPPVAVQLKNGTYGAAQ